VRRQHEQAQKEWQQKAESELDTQRREHEESMASKIKQAADEHEAAEKDRWERHQAEQARYLHEREEQERSARDEAHLRREAEAMAMAAARKVEQHMPPQPSRFLVRSEDNSVVIQGLEAELGSINPTQVLSFIGLGRALIVLHKELEKLNFQKGEAVEAHDFATAQNLKARIVQTGKKLEAGERRCGEAKRVAEKLNMLLDAFAQILHKVRAAAGCWLAAVRWLLLTAVAAVAEGRLALAPHPSPLTLTPQPHHPSPSPLTLAPTPTPTLRRRRTNARCWRSSHGSNGSLSLEGGRGGRLRAGAAHPLLRQAGGAPQAELHQRPVLRPGAGR
jgi:hypothetical protein